MRDKYKKWKKFETLERLKRWPSMMKRFPKVRIFSAEHGAYWRGTGQGYTDEPSESAVWDISEAFERTRHCCEMKMIRFVPENTEASHGVRHERNCER